METVAPRPSTGTPRLRTSTASDQHPADTFTARRGTKWRQFWEFFVRFSETAVLSLLSLLEAGDTTEDQSELLRIVKQ